MVKQRKNLSFLHHSYRMTIDDVFTRIFRDLRSIENYLLKHFPRRNEIDSILIEKYPTDLIISSMIIGVQ